MWSWSGSSNTTTRGRGAPPARCKECAMAHTHTFWVFNTSTDAGAIMVLCRCGQFGTVAFDDHTEEAWQAACQAPRRQSLWHGNHRVTLRWTLDAQTTKRWLCPAALAEPL